MNRFVIDLLLQLILELIKASWPTLMQALIALAAFWTYPITLPMGM
jgi:hypothetical protein